MTTDLQFILCSSNHSRFSIVFIYNILAGLNWEPTQCIQSLMSLITTICVLMLPGDEPGDVAAEEHHHGGDEHDGQVEVARLLTGAHLPHLNCNKGSVMS